MVSKWNIVGCGSNAENLSLKGVRSTVVAFDTGEFIVI